MGFNKLSALLAAAVAISTPGAARAACDPAAGLTFVCELTNAEDLVQVPGTPWMVASGLADGEHTGGHIYLVNAHERTVQVQLPATSPIGRTPRRSCGPAPPTQSSAAPVHFPS